MTAAFWPTYLTTLRYPIFGTTLGMTFYMKNLAMELDQERRDRQDAERRSAASKEALAVLYKELRTVQVDSNLPPCLQIVKI
jgi:hypothetical protein